MSTYFLVTLLGKYLLKSAGEKPIPSNVDSTPVEVKYEDIPEERRKQFEPQLKKEQDEATRRLLACYGKTQQGIVKMEQFVMPTTPVAGNASFIPHDFLKQFIDCRCPDLAVRHQLVKCRVISLPRWLMQEATQERTIYSGSGRGAVLPARGCARALYYLAPGVPVVGGYKRGERGREAPKSLLEERLIEANANIGA